MTRIFNLLMALALVSSSALAQDADSIKGAVGAPKSSSMGNLGGDLNFGMIDGDMFTTVNLGFAMDLGKIGFGLQVPLRIRVADNAEPENEVGIREEDWDEWTDYLKIIRYIRYGRKGEFLHVMVGDLPGATLGHGTIVSHYYNNIDLDHYKMGFVFDLNTDYGGLETLFNNGFVTNLFGVRGYVRPWSFIDTESYMNNLAVGFSVVSDYAAPYTLVAGEVEDGYGDIEFRLLNTSLISMTPYMDLNGILDAGIGYHAGVLTVFHISGISLDLQTRLEYRYFTGDYIPSYFNSYYEIQKFSYPYHDDVANLDAEAPKRQVLDQLGDTGLNGYYAELTFRFLELFTIGASYDDYDGLYNSNLRIYLDVPALEVFQFGCYYYKHNFEGASEAFSFDDKSLFLVEARYQITSFLYVLGQYWRIWQLNQEEGTYEAVDDWSVGLGMAYNF
jgi:hypothetical protein